MSSAAERARAWRRDTLALVCDEITPWAFGRVVRARRFPRYWDYNAVVLERESGLGAAQLAAVADDLLAGLTHRRIDVEDEAEATRLRADFARLGWRTFALLWMLFDGDTPAPAARPADSRPEPVSVAEVPYDEVAELKHEWHAEDFPDVPASDIPVEAREVALLRSTRVLAVKEGGRPVAFAQLDRGGSGLEISEVFVTRERRGSGLGTAVTSAAIAAAAGGGDLWISADDDDRAKHLYARLGFRPVCRTLQCQRLPSG